MPARPACQGASSSFPTQDERGFGGRYHERWIGVDELDAGPVWSHELGGAVGDLSGVVAQKAKHARRAVASAGQLETHAISRDHRYRRIVGGVNRLEAKAQPFGEKGQCGVQVLAGQYDLCGFGRFL